MFWLIAYGAALGAAGHAGIAACIVLLQQGASLTRAFAYLQAYVAAPFGAFLLCYLVISAWYCIVVLSRATMELINLASDWRDASALERAEATQALVETVF